MPSSRSVAVATTCLLSATLSLHSGVDAMAPPAMCVDQMNALCNADTTCVDEVKRDGGLLPLIALFDGDADPGSQPAWRCYSPSSLNADRTRYVNGTLYCSDSKQLEAVLSECTQTTVFRSGDNDTHCFRIPNVLQVPSAAQNEKQAPKAAAQSVLLAFTEGRELSCSDSGPKYIALRRSLDGGATWLPMQSVVRDPAGTLDGLNLGTSTYDAHTGEVFVHYTFCAHACKTAGLFVVSSTDAGATWGEPVNLTDTAVAAGWAMVNPGPGTGVQLASSSGAATSRNDVADYDGRLVVPFWGKRVENPTLAEGGAAALYSDDHGKTWTFSSEPFVANAEMGPNECQLAVYVFVATCLYRDAFVERSRTVCAQPFSGVCDATRLLAWLCAL